LAKEGKRVTQRHQDHCEKAEDSPHNDTNKKANEELRMQGNAGAVQEEIPVFSVSPCGTFYTFSLMSLCLRVRLFPTKSPLHYTGSVVALTIISSAAMLTAISAGVLAFMAMPMGLWTRSISFFEKPCSRSLSEMPSIFFLLPIAPM